MATLEDQPVTQLLQAACRGDREAAAELVPVLYGELRKLADSWMAKLPEGQTLQPTALVHEAYLRLVEKGAGGWENRRHFFFAAARAMHDILVEQARQKASLKRGGDRKRVNADNLVIAVEAPAEDMLALHDALERLEREDPRKHQIVLLRFFAGLTEDEVAGIMDISVRTLQREWRYIRAKLHKELAEAGWRD
jgi:RNA polymerase sigma factor (TIGR02999 family)